MICKYTDYDPTRYATGLHQEQGQKLNWESAGGQDVLIIQTPYEETAVDHIDEICEALSERAPERGKYVEVCPDVWVRLVTAMDKVREKGCPIHAKATTYTVLSCYEQDQVFYICAPHEQSMHSPFFRVPLEIHVDIHKETVLRGLFKKKEMDTGYYSLTFPQDIAAIYTDGSLGYQPLDAAKPIVIPITTNMVKQGTVYVRTSEPPKLIMKSKGLKLR